MLRFFLNDHMHTLNYTHLAHPIKNCLKTEMCEENGGIEVCSKAPKHQTVHDGPNSGRHRVTSYGDIWSGCPHDFLDSHRHWYVRICYGYSKNKLLIKIITLLRAISNMTCAINILYIPYVCHAYQDTYRISSSEK